MQKVSDQGFRSDRPPGAKSPPLISRNVGTSADTSTRKLDLFGDYVEGRYLPLCGGLA